MYKREHIYAKGGFPGRTFLDDRLVVIFQCVTCIMIECLVIFHLALQAVACSGDIDYAVMMGSLYVRPVFVFTVGRSLRQLKEAVHGYRHVHLALGNHLCRYHSGHCRSRVALRGSRRCLLLLGLRLFGCRAA